MWWALRVWRLHEGWPKQLRRMKEGSSRLKREVSNLRVRNQTLQGGGDSEATFRFALSLHLLVLVRKALKTDHLAAGGDFLVHLAARRGAIMSIVTLPIDYINRSNSEFKEWRPVFCQNRKSDPHHLVLRSRKCLSVYAKG